MSIRLVKKEFGPLVNLVNIRIAKNNIEAVVFPTSRYIYTLIDTYIKDNNIDVVLLAAFTTNNTVKNMSCVILNKKDMTFVDTSIPQIAILNKIKI